MSVKRTTGTDDLCSRKSQTRNPRDTLKSLLDEKKSARVTKESYIPGVSLILTPETLLDEGRGPGMVRDLIFEHK